ANPRIPHWLDSTARPFTHALSDADPSFWGVAIGQAIFTPQDIQANPAPPDQHPYAGWLFMQLMVAAEAAPSDRRTGHPDTDELECGMVGLGALGGEAKNSIQKVLGARSGRGGASQLPDEFAFAASFDRRWRWLPFGVPGIVGLSFDVTPQIGFTLGDLR